MDTIDQEAVDTYVWPEAGGPGKVIKHKPGTDLPEGFVDSPEKQDAPLAAVTSSASGQSVISELTQERDAALAEVEAVKTAAREDADNAEARIAQLATAIDERDARIVELQQDLDAARTPPPADSGKTATASDAAPEKGGKGKAKK